MRSGTRHGQLRAVTQHCYATTECPASDFRCLQQRQRPATRSRRTHKHASSIEPRKSSHVLHRPSCASDARNSAQVHAPGRAQRVSSEPSREVMDVPAVPAALAPHKQSLHRLLAARARRSVTTHPRAAPLARAAARTRRCTCSPPPCTRRTARSRPRPEACRTSCTQGTWSSTSARGARAIECNPHGIHPHPAHATGGRPRT